MLRQHRWLGFTAFLVVMIGLCLVLARWQWGRYQQRSAQNDRLDAALAASPVPLDALVAARRPDEPPVDLPRELEWRTVVATGDLDPTRQVAVRRRPLDGRNGFWIVTPLITDLGVVLVNRGWVAARGDARSTPEVVDPPAGPVTIEGRLRPVEHVQRDDPPSGQAWAVDPEVLLGTDPAPRYDAYVDLRASQPPVAEGLVTLPDPGHRGLNNLVYSVQWVVFGAVGAFGWWRLLRSEARRQRAGAVVDGPSRPS